jgi:PAS domain S-box-containing protein
MGRRSGKFVNAIDHFSEPVDRLRAALDASCVVGTWDWDLARGSMIYDAGAAQLLTGDASLADQEIYGMDAIAAVHPADHEWLVEHVEQGVRTGGLMVAEYRVLAEDGTIRWLLSRGRTYHDPAGHPVRSRGIIIDITETHETGERYVITNPMTLEDPLDRAADMAITLKRMLGEVASAEVRASVDLLLLSLGRAIAQGSGRH